MEIKLTEPHSHQSPQRERPKRHLLAGFSLTMAMIFVPLQIQAQTMTTRTAEERLQALEDRAALKTLVDTFSNLGDTKDVAAQVLLFTEDATVSSVSGGQPGSSFKGRKEIGDAFGGYLANFETVYHINGQQTVELNGDTATGTAYCLVVLIADEAGKKVKNTSGVTYHDEYVRREGRWLIAKRTSNFTWHERQELGE